MQNLKYTNEKASQKLKYLYFIDCSGIILEELINENTLIIYFFDIYSL